MSRELKYFSFYMKTLCGQTLAGKLKYLTFFQRVGVLVISFKELGRLLPLLLEEDFFFCRQVYVRPGNGCIDAIKLMQCKINFLCLLLKMLALLDSKKTNSVCP